MKATRTSRIGKRGPAPKPIADRLAARLVTTESGCREWTGADKDGYGRILVGSRADGSRRLVYTHRLAWELQHGPIPGGMIVCHACDNPPCCNPGHLFLGTPEANMRDMAAKGRRINSPHAGVTNGRALITELDAENIRAAYASGESQTSIARRYPISRTTVGYIVRGEIWSAA